MALIDNGRKIAAASHQVAFEQPMSASFMQACDIQENRPGTIITDEVFAISGLRVTAQVSYQGIANPEQPGTKSDFSVTYQTFTNSLCNGNLTPTNAGVTIACPTMIAIDNNIDGESSPVKQTQHLRYTGTSLNPISVTF